MTHSSLVIEKNIHSTSISRIDGVFYGRLSWSAIHNGKRNEAYSPKNKPGSSYTNVLNSVNIL